MKKTFSILLIIALITGLCLEASASRLPVAGEKNWGAILSDFLLVAHNSDGTLTPNSVSLTNKSGGAVAQYDVVIVGTAFDNSFSTTTTAGNVNVIGVAQEAIADNASGAILPPSALTTVNIKAAVTIVRGDYLITSTVAGKADRSAIYTDGAFARALTGGTGTVTAILINQLEDYSASRTLTGNLTFTPASGGTVFAAGNIGVGIASPTGKIDVRDGAFTLTDADVAHGLTSAGFGWSTNSFLYMKPNSETLGGLQMIAGTDGDSTPLILTSVFGVADPTDATSAIILEGGKSNGAGNWAALAATETVLQIRNYTTDLLTVLGSGKVGVSITTPDTRLHIYNGDSGGSSHALATMTIEGSSEHYIQLLVPGNAGGAYAEGIFFGDAIANRQGAIVFDHNTNNFSFSTDNGVSNPINFNSTGQFQSTLATGTAPIVVASTTKVTNLNADLFDGYNSGNGTGAIPISNGTVNTNLNADLLDGYTASNASASIPISNGTVNSNLNATMHNGLKITVINIGDWNMDTTSAVAVAHGLTFANIRAVKATIRNDLDTIYSDLSSYDINSTPSIYAEATTVTLVRLDTGWYDKTTHDSISFNRGWITIWYQ